MSPSILLNMVISQNLIPHFCYMMGIDLISDWAKKHNVVLFVLPPYTSHLTQPLDVGAFGPLKSMYSKECQMYLQKHPAVNITKYEIAELTRRPYLREYDTVARQIITLPNTACCFCNVTVTSATFSAEAASTL